MPLFCGPDPAARIDCVEGACALTSRAYTSLLAFDMDVAWQAEFTAGIVVRFR